MNTGRSWRGGGVMSSVTNYSGEFDVDSAYEKFASYRGYFLLIDLLYILAVAFCQKQIARLGFSELFVNELTLIWNAMNALFNIYCTVCLFPDFLHAVSRGWYHLLCKADSMYTDSLSGPALYLFFWSKSWEFGDTLLLIMRGRKVLFLHAYHHFLVLIQASISYVNAGSVVRLGTMMNTFVLSMMYTYFVVVQAVSPAARHYAAVITLMQLAQFLVGIFGLVSALGFMVFGRRTCDTNLGILLLNLFAYLTFLLLFYNFFYRSYMERRRMFEQSQRSEKNLNWNAYSSVGGGGGEKKFTGGNGNTNAARLVKSVISTVNEDTRGRRNSYFHSER